MSSSQQTPWSNNPNAPKISYQLYIQEKIYFFGILVDPILYGFLVVLFFRCMAALFDPVHRRGERTKWGLVSYTFLMFLVATAQTAMSWYLRVSSYVDNREFPGIEGAISPGPVGYRSFIYNDALAIADNAVSYLGTWLADGLLLYRCYIIYSKNLWVIAFPCLMYLGSFGKHLISYKQTTVALRANAINTVIGILYQVAGSKGASYSSAVTDFGLPCLSITVSLNILLTLMIIIRLILHTRNIRTAMGITGIGGLSKAIITMLVESCALHTMSSLFVFAPWAAGYHYVMSFVPILTRTQVIAPLLIIQRVANKSALTKNTVVPGRLSSFKTRTRGEATGSDGALPCGDPVSPVDGYGMPGSGELGVEVETTIDLHQDRT